MLKTLEYLVFQLIKIKSVFNFCFMTPLSEQSHDLNRNSSYLTNPGTNSFSSLLLLLVDAGVDTIDILLADGSSSGGLSSHRLDMHLFVRVQYSLECAIFGLLDNTLIKHLLHSALYFTCGMNLTIQIIDLSLHHVHCGQLILQFSLLLALGKFVSFNLCLASSPLS